MRSQRLVGRLTVLIGYLAITVSALILLINSLSEHLPSSTIFNEERAALVGQTVLDIVLALAFWIVTSIQVSDPMQARRQKMAFFAFSAAGVLLAAMALTQGLVYTNFNSDPLTPFGWDETAYFIETGGGVLFAVGLVLVARSVLLHTPTPPDTESPREGEFPSNWHRENFG